MSLAQYAKSIGCPVHLDKGEEEEEEEEEEEAEGEASLAVDSEAEEEGVASSVTPAMRYLQQTSVTPSHKTRNKATTPYKTPLAPKISASPSEGTKGGARNVQSTSSGDTQKQVESMQKVKNKRKKPITPPLSPLFDGTQSQGD